MLKIESLLNNKSTQLELKHHLSIFNCGIEKESLRTSYLGNLANSSHPQALGHALKHPFITTDFAESQLELITPVSDSTDKCLDDLTSLHSYVYHHLGNELLWAASMPCNMKNNPISIARYGRSNLAKLKQVYRRGLAARYGKPTQLITGIHYNFSFADESWLWYQNWLLASQETNDEKNKFNVKLSITEFKNKNYLHMMRNFYRFSPLLLYLFGASPACSADFNTSVLNLRKIGKNTLYLPSATSLRLSDLGYTNPYKMWTTANSLNGYCQELLAAINMPCRAYSNIGVVDRGQYKQLSANVLQIENEDYTIIRPKRSGAWNSRPLKLLQQQGIEYIETRLFDVNPLLPLGIDKTQINFLHCFLVYCLLADSSPINSDEMLQLHNNYKQVTIHGRDKNLYLNLGDSKILFRSWMTDLLDEMYAVASILDDDSNSYQQDINLQLDKVKDVNLTPSALLLNSLFNNSISYVDFILEQSVQHQDYFTAQKLTLTQQDHFDRLAVISQQEVQALERKQEVDFKQFLSSYMNT